MTDGIDGTDGTDGIDEAVRADEAVGHGGRFEDVSRRQFLGATGAAVAGVGGARALHNTVLGYGEFGFGTNLLEQDLEPLLTERLRVGYDESIDDARLWLADDSVGIETADGDRYGLGFEEDDATDAERLDAELRLDGRLVGAFVDGRSLRDGAYEFEFHDPEAFFDRVDGAAGRPDSVSAIRSRRDRTVDPTLVERFTGGDPADSESLVVGLKEGFREHGSYDVPRYVAGSIEDNVIFGARDLRARFEEPVDFESLLEADGTGLFCWELVFRSIEAFQALPPWEQTVPLAACYVSDRRHKHAFTGLVTAIDDGGLVFPTTFVDYTYSTLYDDFGIRRFRGEGLTAYDDGHRADDIYW